MTVVQMKERSVCICELDGKVSMLAFSHTELLTVKVILIFRFIKISGTMISLMSKQIKIE